MNRLILASALCLFAGIAQGQLIADFESPAFAASATGTTVNGQNGWYTPDVAGTVDSLVYTYTGNARGIVANPTGGSQFLGGRSEGNTNLSRAQHNVDFSTANVWTFSFDFACNYDGIVPATPNLASFSTQPTGPKQFIALHNFVDANDPTLGWKLEYNVADVNGTSLLNQSPGAEWTNFTFNHWYRESLTVNFTTGKLTNITITDLTTNATLVANPDWYLTMSTDMPTAIRCFAGGSTAGSIAAWDNVSVTPACSADFNGDNVVDFFDYLDFVDAFAANLPSADFNNDQVIDFFDYLDFVDAFAAGC